MNKVEEYHITYFTVLKELLIIAVICAIASYFLVDISEPVLNIQTKDTCGCTTGVKNALINVTHTHSLLCYFIVWIKLTWLLSCIDIFLIWFTESVILLKPLHIVINYFKSIKYNKIKTKEENEIKLNHIISELNKFLRNK